MMKKILILLSLFLLSINIYSEELKLFPAKNWDGTFCYIDEKGEVIIEGEITEADDFSEGLARVKIDKEYVFIDQTGKVVIKSPEYNTKGKIHFKILGSFHDGLARCEFNNYDMNIGGEGFIDKKGNPVISEYADFTKSTSKYYFKDFNEGFAVISHKSKYGYINTKGEIIFPIKLAKADTFSDGMAKVLYPNKDLFGYIDSTGEIAIKPRFTYGNNFSEGLAIVQEYVSSVKKNVIIDKVGNVISTLPNKMKLSSSSNFNDGIAKIDIYVSDWYPEMASRIISKNGNTIKQFKRGTVLSKFSEGYAFAYNEGFIGIVDKFGDFTYENFKEKLLYFPDAAYYPRPVIDIEPISDFKNGLAKIKKDREIGYMDFNGSIVYMEN